MNKVQETYKTTVAPKLMAELKAKSPIAVPKLAKIVVNMGIHGALQDKKNVQAAQAILTQITGQKPKVTKAKKAIASFKLRQGDEVGAMVTLRGKRMYDFYERLVGVVLPRLRDFHGVSRNYFDSRGNYTLGFSEHTVFPEIDPGKVERMQGLQVCIVTTANDTIGAIALLEALGMPFEKVK